MRKVVCLGNGPVMSFTPYMSKLALTLHHQGVLTEFVTWSREHDVTTAKDPSSVTTTVLYTTPKTGKFLLVLQYFVWMLLVFKYVLRSEHEHYICSRFENAFPVYMASFFKKISYIYADRDAIHLTYKWPGILRFLLKKIETSIASRAKVHLLPGCSRNFTNLPNVHVVPNIPSSWSFESARSIYALRVKEGLVADVEKLTIYINGWVVPTRGLIHIKNAINNAAFCEKVNFIFAGDMPSDLLSELSTHENCSFLGRISNEESLSYYFESDFVITLYDPSIKINVLAEPNKWWDCVYTGTKFISNYGIETIKLFDSIGKYFLINYSDEYSLDKFISNVISQPDMRKTDSVEIMHREFWDEKVELIVKGFLDER